MTPLRTNVPFARQIRQAPQQTRQQPEWKKYQGWLFKFNEELAAVGGFKIAIGMKTANAVKKIVDHLMEYGIDESECRWMMIQTIRNWRKLDWPLVNTAARDDADHPQHHRWVSWSPWLVQSPERMYLMAQAAGLGSRIDEKLAAIRQEQQAYDIRQQRIKSGKRNLLRRLKDRLPHESATVENDERIAEWDLALTNDGVDVLSLVESWLESGEITLANLLVSPDSSIVGVTPILYSQWDPAELAKLRAREQAKRLAEQAMLASLSQTVRTNQQARRREELLSRLG
jgi:hypothetical protein